MGPEREAPASIGEGGEELAHDPHELSMTACFARTGGYSLPWVPRPADPSPRSPRALELTLVTGQQWLPDLCAAPGRLDPTRRLERTARMSPIRSGVDSPIARSHRSNDDSCERIATISLAIEFLYPTPHSGRRLDQCSSPLSTGGPPFWSSTTYRESLWAPLSRESRPDLHRTSSGR